MAASRGAGMTPKIPVLAIRQPWAGLIESKRKTIEIRKYPAPKKYIGQKISIYASRTNPVSSEVEHVRHMLYQSEKDLNLPGSCNVRGGIIAVATLESSLLCVSSLDFNCWQPDHWNPLKYYQKNKTFYWTLKDIQSLAYPVPFKFSGSMVWSSIEAAKVEEFLDEDN
ncbi:MAG: hypothetical protein Q8910_02445 [Bacteroidota bacterium]|nr:hypothetical protein [Bacteroidota bacterium]